MPTATVLRGSAARARRFWEYEKDRLYVGIGKTSEWEGQTYSGPHPINDDRPPIPHTTETNIIEAIGYKRVLSQNVYLCKRDEDIDIEEGNAIFHGGKKYRIIPYDDAVDKVARWLYLFVWLDPGDFNGYEGEYRQAGLFSRLEKMEDIPEDKHDLIPEEVKDVGILEVLSNRVPEHIGGEVSRAVSFMIEF